MGGHMTWHGTGAGIGAGGEHDDDSSIAEGKGIESS